MDRTDSGREELARSVRREDIPASLSALRTFLDSTGLPYAFLPNARPLRSAQEGASFFGIDIAQTAPALVARSEEGFHLVIVSGAHGKVDFGALAPLFGVRTLGLAKPDEVERHAGARPGSVPLVIPKLPCVVDDDLFSWERIYGGSGDPGWTLCVHPKVLDAANNVVSRFRF
jgi:prolyl-tRNA editing enzyme YbaK/EbsC (Cys-tRNA(Pro) deacylase)